MITNKNEFAKVLAKNNMYAEESSGIYRRCCDTAPLGMDNKMLSIMRANDVKIITVSDAHCPEDVGYRIREMQELIEESNKYCYQRTFNSSVYA